MFLCFFSSSAELKVGVTPGTSYAMEYSSLQITCTAYDDANEEMPQSIQFIEIDDYSNKKNLTDKDSNLNFTTTLHPNYWDAGRLCNKLLIIVPSS